MLDLPTNNILDELKSSDIGNEILDSTIGTKEELWEQKKQIEEDKTIDGFEKMIETFKINLQGKLLFGLDREDEFLEETEEDSNKKTDKEEKTETKESTNTVSDKYDTKNIKTIEDALMRYNITNPYIKKAILATIAKESWFKPQIAEKSYKNTNNKRIRRIFGARVSGLSDTQLTTLKANEEAFRDRVYGPDDPTGQSQKYGNTQKWDGMKYRWRWFNGITFKSNYEKYGNMINEDLVNNPELLEKPEIAAKVNAAYFADGLSNQKIIQTYGNTAWVNDFNDFETALKAAIHINAGIGKKTNTSNFQENYNKALAASAYLNDQNYA